MSAQRVYRASLSRSQDRAGWSIIFRHPLREDRVTGKPGLRIRRGLGTTDSAEAEALVSQMDRLLAEPAYWDVAAMKRASTEFDERIVRAFYDSISPAVMDFWGIRNAVIPLPNSQDSQYRRLLLVGTTGSGKTTLVRQLMGTDPKTERFPSTSTAKTTVADTEVVLDDGPYRAVVTFMPQEEARDYLEQCIAAATISATDGAKDDDILERTLNHVSQRFRLKYVLGPGRQTDDEDLDLDDEELELEDIADDSLAADFIAPVDLIQTNVLLRRAIGVIREAAARHKAQLTSELGPTDAELRVVDALFEEEIDGMLRQDEQVQELVDEILDEIKTRFDAVRVGDFERAKTGWPASWSWETSERETFLTVVTRFTSNYARFFGSLLTPLVNGVRVAGPFRPEWSGTQPKLVILDGEGLGHTPETAVSLPTSLTRRFPEVDAVVLVDNATQPMQPGAVTLLRGLAASGQSSKLITCFTHFDEVRGDNLPTFHAKERHIRESAENSLTEIARIMGASAERVLRRRLDMAAIFVGGIQQNLDGTSNRARRTLTELRRFLELAEATGLPRASSELRPTYNVMKLSLLVQEAAQQYHRRWRALLGKIYDPETSKEHWARIKALSRRLATSNEDGYNGLFPVADLHKFLQEQIRSFIEVPIDWENAQPSEADKDALFEAFAESVSGKLLNLVQRRVWRDELPRWNEAFSKSGRGSTLERADIIADSILEHAAPVPTIVPNKEGDLLLSEIHTVLKEAAEQCKVTLV